MLRDSADPVKSTNTIAQLTPLFTAANAFCNESIRIEAHARIVVTGPNFVRGMAIRSMTAVRAAHETQ